MGDLFFLIRMIFYTVIVVIIMQVKIGSTTIEEKVINFTHNSSFSANIQEVADGAIRALGVGYNRIVQNINTSFTRNHSKDNVPGHRLDKTIEATKSILRKTFGAEGDTPVEESAPESDQQDESSGSSK